MYLFITQITKEIQLSIKSLTISVNYKKISNINQNINYIQRINHKGNQIINKENQAINCIELS